MLDPFIRLGIFWILLKRFRSGSMLLSVGFILCEIIARLNLPGSATCLPIYYGLRVPVKSSVSVFMAVQSQDLDMESGPGSAF